MGPGASLHKFVVVLAFVAVALIISWLSGEWSGTKGLKDCDRVWTTDRKQSICKELLYDKTAFDGKVDKGTKQKVAAYDLDELIRAKLREQENAEAASDRQANEIIAKKEENKLGNFPADVRARAQRYVDQALALLRRQETEEQAKIYEEGVETESRKEQFNRVELQERRLKKQFDDALSVLRRELAAAVQPASLGEGQQSAIADAKAAVIAVLDELLKRLNEVSDYKLVKAAFAKKTGFNTAALRQQLANQWDGFFTQCRGREAPTGCWLRFISANSGLTVQTTLAEVDKAFNDGRFYDAIGLSA